jgi:hypothetical protein
MNKLNFDSNVCFMSLSCPKSNLTLIQYVYNQNEIDFIKFIYLFIHKFYLKNTDNSLQTFFNGEQFRTRLKIR